MIDDMIENSACILRIVSLGLLTFPCDSYNMYVNSLFHFVLKVSTAKLHHPVTWKTILPVSISHRRDSFGYFQVHTSTVLVFAFSELLSPEASRQASFVMGVSLSLMPNVSQLLLFKCMRRKVRRLVHVHVHVKLQVEGLTLKQTLQIIELLEFEFLP